MVIHAGPGPKKVTVCSQCHGLPIQHDHKTIACGSCRCLSVRLAGLKCGGCIPRGCCKASFQMRNDESNPVLCQDQCGLFFTWVHLPSFAVLLVTRLTSCADVGSSAALKLERIRTAKTLLGETARTLLQRPYRCPYPYLQIEIVRSWHGRVDIPWQPPALPERGVGTRCGE